MPFIIGLTGFKRSGKNTAGQFIEDLILEENENALSGDPVHPICVYQLSFARPLKQICCDVFGWDERHVDGDLKEVPDERFHRSSKVALAENFKLDLALIIKRWVNRPADRQDAYAELDKVFRDYKEAIQPAGPKVLTPRFAMQHLGTEFGRWMYTDTWTDLLIRKAQKAKPEDVVVVTDVRFMNEVNCVKEQGGVVWKVRRPEVEPTDTTNLHQSEAEMLALVPDLVLDNTGTLEDLKANVRSALSDALAKRRLEEEDTDEALRAVVEETTCG